MPKKRNVGQVFIAGGQPTITYNARASLKLEAKLKSYLVTGHKALSVTGPTKSGKTVLCRKVIPKDEGIWINGGEISSEQDFWDRINAEGIGLQARASFRSGFIVSCSKFIRLMLQVSMLGVGAWLVIQGEITAGAMIAASILMSRSLASALTTLRSAAAAKALSRLFPPPNIPWWRPRTATARPT